MASEPTTEYERKRVENIRRNDEMMAALKLLQLSSAKPPQRPHKKKKPRPETPTVVRRSLRTRGLPSQISHLQEEDPPVGTMPSKFPTAPSESDSSDSADSGSDSDSPAHNQNRNHHIKSMFQSSETPVKRRRVEMDHRRKKKKFWTHEDEIVILKCMIRFRKRGKDPFYQIAQFFDSIKHLLGGSDVNKDQLYNKIRTIRRKYLHTLKKVNTTGAEDARPRNKKVYHLSKKMWPNIRLVVQENGEKNRGIAASSAKPKADNLGALFQKKGRNLIAARFDKQWKNVMIAEAKAYLQRIDLIREQTQAMLDALESTHL